MPRREHIQTGSEPQYPYNIVFSSTAPTLIRSAYTINYSITESGIITSINSTVGAETIVYFCMHLPTDNVGTNLTYTDATVCPHTPCKYEVTLYMQDTEMPVPVSTYFTSMGNAVYNDRYGAWGYSHYNNWNTIKTNTSFPFIIPDNERIGTNNQTYTYVYINAIYLCPIKFAFKPNTAGEYDIVVSLKNSTEGTRRALVQPNVVNRKSGPILGGYGGGVTSDIIAQNTLHINVT